MPLEWVAITCAAQNHVMAERDPPKRRVRELWAVVGRRGGKDSVASVVACFASGFIDYKKVLRPGERASVLYLAVDKAQAGIVEKYTRAYFADVPLLRGQVTRETADGLELTTGAELDVLASNFRNVRGRSIALRVTFGHGPTKDAAAGRRSRRRRRHAH